MFKVLKSVVAAAVVSFAVGAQADTVSIGNLTTFGQTVAIDPLAFFSRTYSFTLAGSSSFSGDFNEIFGSLIGKSAITGLTVSLSGPGGSIPLTLTSTGDNSFGSTKYSTIGIFGAGSYSFTASGTGGTNGSTYLMNLSAAPVPEPEGYAMLLAGLGLVGVMVVKRRKS